MEIQRLYDKMYENGSLENLKQILETIAPYVIVTGSYAYRNQRPSSDIDMYVKEIPEEDVDCEADFVEDTYVSPLIRYFEELGYDWDSCMSMSFDVSDTYIPLEFSALYSIEEDTFPVEIFGVKMTAAKSTHTSEKYYNGQKRSRINA